MSGQYALVLVESALLPDESGCASPRLAMHVPCLQDLRPEPTPSQSPARQACRPDMLYPAWAHLRTMSLLTQTHFPRGAATCTVLGAEAPRSLRLGSYR